MRRRQFLTAPLALAAGIRLQGDEKPKALEVTDPRATSGDPVEPNWESGNTVTVGPHRADMVGSDQKAIQAAVDYVARLGGGTVRILPGTYRMRNAVYLRSRVRIVGNGLWIACAALLALAAVAACLIPARRAARVGPMVAVRY